MSVKGVGGSQIWLMSTIKACGGEYDEGSLYVAGRALVRVPFKCGWVNAAEGPRKPEIRME